MLGFWVEPAVFAHMVAKSGVWAHLPARAYWALTAVWSAITVAQSAPLVAHGGYGPPGGVVTLSWVVLFEGAPRVSPSARYFSL